MALREADALGAEVLLADRPVGVTLARLSAALERTDLAHLASPEVSARIEALERSLNLPSLADDAPSIARAVESMKDRRSVSAVTKFMKEEVASAVFLVRFAVLPLSLASLAPIFCSFSLSLFLSLYLAHSLTFLVRSAPALPLTPPAVGKGAPAVRRHARRAGRIHGAGLARSERAEGHRRGGHGPPGRDRGCARRGRLAARAVLPLRRRGLESE